MFVCFLYVYWCFWNLIVEVMIFNIWWLLMCLVRDDYVYWGFSIKAAKWIKSKFWRSVCRWTSSRKKSKNLDKSRFFLPPGLWTFTPQKSGAKMLIFVKFGAKHRFPICDKLVASWTTVQRIKKILLFSPKGRKGVIYDDSI